MKKFLSLLIISLATLSYGVSQAKSNKVLAIVNGEVISQVDVNDRVTLALKLSGMKDTKQNRKTMNEQMLRSVINETLQLQTAKKYKITVSDAQIKLALKNYAAQYGASVETLKAQLKKQGVSINALQQQMKANVAWSILVREVFGGQLHVSDKEIASYLAHAKAQENSAQRHLAEIFIPFGRAQNEAKALAQARSIAQQAANGANFSALAKQFSSSPSAIHGGDIGWIRVGSMPAETEKMLSTIPTKKISHPIRSTKGYHLYYVKAKKAAGASYIRRISLHQLAAPLPQQPADEDLHFSFSRMEQLTNDVTSLKALKTLATENKDLKLGSMIDVGYSDLPLPLQQIIAKLKVNRPSKPIHSEDGMTVLFLSKDQKVHVKITKDDAYNALANKKLENIAKRAFGDIYKKAYIDIKTS